MDESELRSNVEEALGPVIIETLVYEIKGTTVILRGTAFSEAQRLWIQELVEGAPGVTKVINELRVELPEIPTVLPHSVPLELDDFQGHVESATENPIQSAAEAGPYFAPVDPVVRTSEKDDSGLEVAGGFAGDDLDQPLGNAERLFPLPADDLICDQVQSMLRLDASTAYLPIFVECDEGVVTLRGRVPSLEDAETAEWIADRIPGVVEVIDELDIEGL